VTDENGVAKVSAGAVSARAGSGDPAVPASTPAPAAAAPPS